MTAATTDTTWYSYTSSTQTMRSWTRVLSSFEEVPEAFQSALARDVPFPYTILLPEDRLSFLQKRREQLLCMDSEQIVVMEAGRDQVNVTPHRIDEIFYLEHGRELLHSWIKIKSASGLSMLSFNTVTMRHFEPIFERIRPKTTAIAGERDLSAFDYLNGINYKFMNFGRQSVRAGENVRYTIYQPDRCIRTVTLFHKTLFKQHATGHLSILTDCEIILIRQTKRTKTEGQNTYGGIFTYIPLHHVQDLSFALDEKKSLCVMTITLAEKVVLRVEFDKNHTELEAFQAAYRDVRTLKRS